MITWWCHAFLLMVQAGLIFKYWLGQRDLDQRRARHYEKSVERSQRIEYKRWRNRRVA